jgi:trk system potassium uptake protein
MGSERYRGHSRGKPDATIRKATLMRVAIAGAGNIGQSIAHAVLSAGHKVLLIERQRPHYRPAQVPDADWMLADACEVDVLEAAGIHTADVVIAATGDDKVNLVFALLCKTEFAVPRVVARVNNPSNQWLFTQQWGVDVAVSTPSTLVAAAEEAVSRGEVVRLMTVHHGEGNIIEVTLPTASHLVGRPLTDLNLPADAALLTITRSGNLLTPAPDLELQADDQLILLVAPQIEDQIRDQLWFSD